MGHRANLILLTESSYELYYSHWSLSLPIDMFWGPEYAISYIKNFERRENDCWLDDVWAEGGALVDPYQKVMILFGGDSLDQDVLLFNAYLELIREVWESWEVRWAHEGILELADYVGYPRSLLESQGNPPISDYKKFSLKAPMNKEWVDSIGSVRTEDRALHFYPLEQSANLYLCRGEELLQEVETEIGLDHCVYAEWTSNFPDSGFHIDIPNKTIHYWSYFGCDEIYKKVRFQWPNWNVIWYKDNFQPHLLLTEGKLKLPEIDQFELWKQLAKSFFMLGSSYDPVKQMKEVLDNISTEAESIYIHPSALHHHTTELSTEQKQAIFDHACRQVLRKQQKAST
jgi:hypothetical protein